KSKPQNRFWIIAQKLLKGFGRRCVLLRKQHLGESGGPRIQAAPLLDKAWPQHQLLERSKVFGRELCSEEPHLRSRHVRMNVLHEKFDCKTMQSMEFFFIRLRRSP